MKEILITSSALIVALLLLRTLFGGKVRRKLIYGAWLLVAARLLIPVQIGHIPFSLLSIAQPVTDAFAQIGDMEVAGVTEQEAHRQVLQDYVEKDTSVFMPEIQDQIQSDIADGISKEEIALRLDTDYPQKDMYRPEVQPDVLQKVEEIKSPISLGQIAATIWLVGVVCMVIWLASTNWLLGRTLQKTARKVECGSPIPVYVSEQAPSPCLVGLFHPAIYLTPESADDNEVRCHVLRHELTHYHHKDNIWALIRCVCLCVYWFNPLVWVAAWFSRRDCELACDEGALIDMSDEERIAYGKALLQVVSHTVLPSRLMLTATTMAESKKQLKERVEFIVGKAKWSLVATVCMIAACILVGCCAAGGPSTVSPDLTEPSTTAPGTTDPIIPSEPSNQNSWEITEEEKLQLKQDYLQSDMVSRHSCTVEDVKLIVISHVESGYAVVIGCKCSSIDFDASWDDLLADRAGDLDFYMPNGWFPSFYKDGQFCNLSGAYNLQWLNYDQLRMIWRDFYAQFPKALETWQLMNGGLKEPPQWDPSGLNYKVNDDGVTCTVTGIGVNNGSDLVIPEYIGGYQVTAIDNMAFFGEYFLTSVTLPDSVVSIGESAFESCTRMKRVVLGTSLETIGWKAFKDCDALEEIQLPNGLKHIESNAFQHCSSLKVLRLPDSMLTLGMRAFSGCSSLTALRIPEGITSIPAGLLENCSSLKDLTLHDGITTISASAFANCKSLTKVDLPKNITRIAASTFAGCAQLREIQIPLSVTSIGSDAFYNCKSLEKMEIHDNIQTIEKRAFGGCSGLTSVYIGKSMCNLGERAFVECGGLLDIQVSADNPTYRAVGGCFIDIQSKTLLFATRNMVIPTDGSVLHIGDYAFLGRADLEVFVVPEGIESIGNDAFQDCENLTQVEIPVSIRTIGSAFANCKKLDLVIYNGTKAQWKAIRTGTVIGDVNNIFIIRCTDGEMTGK